MTHDWIRKNRVEGSQGMVKTLIIGLIFVVIILTVYYSGRKNREIQRYSDMEDIEISHEKELVLAKIDIIDTYTKSGQTYYEIKTNITGERVFTYSEEEYDKVFGLGNDAIDCEIYSLSMKSVILTRSNGISFSGDLEYFDIEVMDYPKLELSAEEMDNQIRDDASKSFDFLLATPNGERKWAFGLSNINSTIFVRSYYGEHQDVQELNSELQEIRYSFLGEVDFSEEEIDVYRKEMHDINLYVLEVYDEQK